MATFAEVTGNERSIENWGQISYCAILQRIIFKFNCKSDFTTM